MPSNQRSHHPGYVQLQQRDSTDDDTALSPSFFRSLPKYQRDYFRETSLRSFRPNSLPAWIMEGSDNEDQNEQGSNTDPNWQPPMNTLSSAHGPPISREEFKSIVESVRSAIREGTYPKRISSGSSGSYFCKNVDGKIVGVFKPKNEEPYGRLNPKWTKWMHRNLFPCFFGRSCLIPNLGYMSESAASLLDRRLNLNIVPATEVTHLSSPTFHYDYLDRRAAKSKRNPFPLPEKIGSFQVFLNGYKDAEIFLRDHPWPNSTNQDIITASAEVNSAMGKEKKKKRLGVLVCRGDGDDDEGNEYTDNEHIGRKFAWTKELQVQFREQFEKLVLLDYLMRNTDRGLDNWMIKYCEKDSSIQVVVLPPEPLTMEAPSNLRRHKVSTDPLPQSIKPITPEITPVGADDDPLSAVNSPSSTNTNLLSSVASSSSVEATTPWPHVHVAAIDNGLSFPFKHPDQWRSYPYGWLFLPDSLVGQPFAGNTRNHFLSLLTSQVWWKETIADLRALFSMDDDFDEGMFNKQIAVLKGQAWNIVETLTQPDQGPLDLCNKENVIVIEEEVEIEMPEETEIDIADLAGQDDQINDTEESTSSRAIPIPAVTPGSYGGFTRKQKWTENFKSKFDSLRGVQPSNNRRTKTVIRERLEPVKGA
ncbi:4476_t:CDS:2, partial [Paraglomus brasilianum]